MKTILCYGDSNTWGFVPGTGQRFDWQTRWPGVAQKEISSDHRIIEEALNGRTTSYDDHTRDSRNGRMFLPIALESHSPLDLVIIALGANDLKAQFNLAPFDIARGASKLVEVALSWQPPVPGVLLVSPAHFVEADRQGDLSFAGAAAKSRELAQHYRYFAKQLGCEFFDAAKVVVPSSLDGLHWAAEEHRKFGKAIADKIMEIL